MIVLGIETATDQVGVALGDHQGVLASFGATTGRRHAEALTPAIDFVCRQAQVSLDKVAVLAVDLGPGLFTGLRVGVATAKAMAQALRVPTIGLCSLDLLAFPVRHAKRLIVAVVDARRGEVFRCLYRQVPGGVQRLVPPRLCSPEDLASEIEARREETLVVGNGALRYAGIVARDARVEVSSPGHAHPSASDLVELAHARALREEFVQPAELVPMYLRKPDATVNWEQHRPPPGWLPTPEPGSAAPAAADGPAGGGASRRPGAA